MTISTLLIIIAVAMGGAVAASLRMRGAARERDPTLLSGWRRRIP